MSWSVERDENGEPVRMVWRGRDEETFKEMLDLERKRCPRCGYPDGWHTGQCKAESESER